MGIFKKRKTPLQELREELEQAHLYLQETNRIISKFYKALAELEAKDESDRSD